MRKETMFQIFTRMPQIATDRLFLRKIQVQDAQDMFAYAQLPEVTKYLTWYEHPDLLYTKRYVAFLQKKYQAAEFYDFAVIHCADNKMIGTCGFARLDPVNLVGEIGYVFHPAYWHHGYATEAVRAVIRFGFEKLHLHRIEARFMINNLASRRVMEKCGMTFEGIHHGSMQIKGKAEDIGVCASINPSHMQEQA